MITRNEFLQSIGLISSGLLIPNILQTNDHSNELLKPTLASPKLENSYWYMGHLLSLLIDSKKSNGTYALIHAKERKGLEPPPHTHTREDESFLVLKGSVNYFVEDQVIEAKAGDVMFLPKNIQHSFKIQSDTLETLILLTPGGFENYFIEMSEQALDLELPPMPYTPPNIERLLAVAMKYGIIFPKI